MEKVKIPTVKADAQIKISVGQTLYKEISKAYFTLMAELSQEDRELLLTELKSKKDNEPLKVSKAKFQPISTLVFLLGFLERTAKDQGQLEDIEMDPEELKKQLEELNKG